MRCRCGGDTRVVDSRAHKDDPRVVVRRRECVSCQDRFTTWEGTRDIAKQRKANRKSSLARYHAMPEEVRKAERDRYRPTRKPRQEAWKEAQKRGVSPSLVRSEWGLTSN